MDLVFGSFKNKIELTKKKQINWTQSNLRICVKQAVKIHNQILEARVTSAQNAVHMFLVNEEIPQKWLQMRCGL